jgi:beta-xylosidase
MHLSLSLIALGFLASPLVAAPTKRALDGPAISSNFPDPSIINAKGSWYAFATTNKGRNVQIAQSQDFDGGWNLIDKDAMPRLPGWISAGNPQVWAPDVIQRVCRHTVRQVQDLLF